MEIPWMQPISNPFIAPTMIQLFQNVDQIDSMLVIERCKRNGSREVGSTTVENKWMESPEADS